MIEPQAFVSWNNEPVFVASNNTSRLSNIIATDAEPSISANVSRVAAAGSPSASSFARNRPARTSLSSSPRSAICGYFAASRWSLTTIPLCSATAPRVMTGWLLSTFDWAPLVASLECPVIATGAPRSNPASPRSSSAATFGLASSSSTEPPCLRTSMRAPSWTAMPAASRPRVTEQRSSATASSRTKSASTSRSRLPMTPKIPHISGAHYTLHNCRNNLKPRTASPTCNKARFFSDRYARLSFTIRLSRAIRAHSAQPRCSQRTRMRS